MMETMPYAPLATLMSELNADEIAQRCSVTRRTVYRWRAAGSLTWMKADEVAVTLGLHPVLIWPEFVSNVTVTPHQED